MIDNIILAFKNAATTATVNVEVDVYSPGITVPLVRLSAYPVPGETALTIDKVFVGGLPVWGRARHTVTGVTTQDVFGPFAGLNSATNDSRTYAAKLQVKIDGAVAGSLEEFVLTCIYHFEPAGTRRR